MRDEMYLVKFWIKSPETGFYSQQEETWFGTSKSQHKKAEAHTIKKFGIKKSDVISVTYC